MADDEFTTRGNGDASGRIAFDYVKSQHFRVIRADGAIGGVTPSGFIHMAFFSERPAIPRRLVYNATSEGTLGKELSEEKVSRDSIVREMDIDLFINLATAISLREWLSKRIDELQARMKSSPAKRSEGQMSVAIALDQDAHYREPLWRTRSASDVSAPAKYEVQRGDYFARFHQLLNQWRVDTVLSSRIQDKVDHPAFQEIVQIGRPAVPLIIRELRQHPDFLFLALHRITGENPVPTTCIKPSEMVEMWLSWAERNNVPAD